MFGPLVRERLDHHLGAGHFSTHVPTPDTQTVPAKKKGHKGPVAHRQFVDGLAIPGGAPSYDYQLSSNKIAHRAVLGIISLRQFIWVAAAGVKELSGFTQSWTVRSPSAIGADTFHPGNIDFDFYPDINTVKQGYSPCLQDFRPIAPPSTARGASRPGTSRRSR
jgi:hypothetical protein